MKADPNRTNGNERQLLCFWLMLPEDLQEEVHRWKAIYNPSLKEGAMRYIIESIPIMKTVIFNQGTDDQYTLGGEELMARWINVQLEKHDHGGLGLPEVIKEYPPSRQRDVGTLMVVTIICHHCRPRPKRKRRRRQVPQFYRELNRQKLPDEPQPRF